MPGALHSLSSRILLSSLLLLCLFLGVSGLYLSTTLTAFLQLNWYF